jgi:hypothetical protein
MPRNNIESDNEKLPLKSINGRRCLTKCFQSGTAYLHPILLTDLFGKENSCAIYPTYSKDPEYYRKRDMILVDTCRLEDNVTHRKPDELESILLSFFFNPSDFLVSIYGLHSFDQVIYWTLENDDLPFDTVKRVHDCAWKVYGDNIVELSNGVLDYYYDICKMYWLKNYVKIIQNKYSFDVLTKKSTVPDNADEIYNIIVNNYFSRDFFIDILHQYINEFQNKWDNIVSHYDGIKKYVFTKLIYEIENKTDDINRNS